MVAGRGQENASGALFSSPRKIIHSIYRHQIFAILTKHYNIIINRLDFNGKWVYL